MAGRDNNYLVGGNIVGAFVVGEIGSEEDFFLVGAEPEQESNYPLLTGNFLDSEGNVLFRLVRNSLMLNPGRCSKILGDHVGYEIHDSAGSLILRVRTIFDSGAASWLTTIEGNFYDRNRKLIMSASPDTGLSLTGTKHAIGFAGGAFGIVGGMDKDDLEFARVVLSTKGNIHTPVRGVIDGQEITLDGKALIGAHLKNCKVHIHSGNFALYGGGTIEGCRFYFHGEAANIQHLFQSLSPPSNRSE